MLGPLGIICVLFQLMIGRKLPHRTLKCPAQITGMCGDFFRVSEVDYIEFIQNWLGQPLSHGLE